MAQLHQHVKIEIKGIIVITTDGKTVTALKKTRHDFLLIGLLVAVTVMLLYPVTTKMAAEHDYITHIERAATLIVNFTFSPHLLYQVSTIIIHAVLPIDIFSAGIFVVLAYYGALAVVIFLFLRSNRDIPRSVLFVATLCLFFAAQIPALFPLDKHLYLGYIAVNALHNPTMVVLKPMALLMFILSGRIFSSTNYSHRKLFVVLCALISILTAFAKPNYTICFLPALCFLLGLGAIRRQQVDWFLALGGFLIPSILFLLFQYLVTYDAFLPQIPRSYEKSQIIFAPLTVMKMYSSWLLPKFLLSIAFPLLVSICYIKKTGNDYYMKFAWLTFFFGGFCTYFLAESGFYRMMQGNFGWSGQITLFVLFVYSTRFFLGIVFSQGQTPLPMLDRKQLFLTVLLAVHVASGILYYFAEYSQPQRYW